MTSSSQRVNVSLIVLCASTQSLAYAGIALFLPLIRRDIGLSFSQAGTLAAASTLVYALMQIPAGFVSHRFGAKRTFMVGLVGTSGLAFAFALLNTFPLLLVDQALTGFFRALVFQPGMLLITGHFPSKRRATAMGLYVAAGFSSNIFLNTIGPLLVESRGWRAMFMLFATTGFAFVITYGFVGEPDRREDDHQDLRLRYLGTLLRNEILWVCGAIQFIRLAIAMGMAFWLPSYLVEDRGFSISTAGLIVALGALITAPSNFLGGYISDRFERPTAVVATSLLALSGSLVALAHVRAVPLLLVVIAVTSIFIQLYFGPLFGIPSLALGMRGAGLMNGFSNSCANLGALTFAYTLGAVRESTGSFVVGFYCLAGMCLIGFALTLRVSKLLRSSGGDLHVVAVGA